MKENKTNEQPAADNIEEIFMTKLNELLELAKKKKNVIEINILNI